MRYALSCILLCAALLSGCQNTPEATSAPSPTQETVQSVPDEGSTPPPETTLEVSGDATEDPLVAAGVTLPLPGTLLAPATEDPDAGVLFDSILYYQAREANNETLTVEVYSDGRVVRNGATSSISQEQVMMLQQMLEDMRFFGMQGTFTAPGRNDDIYYYQVTVERDGAANSIAAQDGYTPPELLELFGVLSDLGA